MMKFDNIGHIQSALLFAQEDTRVFYQWMRLEQLDQWHHWFLLACCVAAIIGWVAFWYRKDWGELPRAVGWSLLLLRLTALIGILIFFLDLQKRSEQRVTRSSKVAILIDTSLSMTMPVDESNSDSPNSMNRIAAIQKVLAQSDLIIDLQKQHDTTVYRFDQNSRPSAIASFAKPIGSNPKSAESESYQRLWRLLSWTAWVGSMVAGVSLALLVGSLLIRTLGSRRLFWSYAILCGVVGTICGFVLVATAILRAERMPWSSLWANAPPIASTTPMELKAAENSQPAIDPKSFAWESSLAASGTESRLGDAINSVLEIERGSPLAGIVVMSDGRSNAGVDPMIVIPEATMQGVPIHTVGLGTARNPINVRILDVEAPKRVFPGDRFRLNALVQSSGLPGKQLSIQLRRRPGGNANAGMAIEEERSITLEGEEELTTLSFDIQPREVGSWVYEVKALVPPQDTNPADNVFESEVRVVEPNSTVLVVAGGPTREYQFVRNLLFRDPTVQSHVYLQSGGPGVSQESKKLLTEFPKTRAEMSQYDAVIAFDVDWMALDIDQVELLEKWIAEQSGGLVIVAGPVATPKWAGNPGNGNRKAEILRTLAPVVMNTRGARLVSIGRFDSETAWPLVFAPDAWSSDFIQIATNLEESQKAWQQFRGVYSFFACHEPKPAATAIAFFSDPTAVVNGAQPIYLATQFYGSGRVAFQGGGEFWRLRDVGENYFDTYYTKLVRWSGQGRLLRDSDRGVLLVDKEQAVVGDQVIVRAVLRDAQFQPLIQNDAPAKLIEPGGRATPLILQPLPDPTQPGVYVGQYITKKTGTYEVQLPVGTITDQTILSQQTVVRVPALEIQRPQRNDALLAELANRTGGRYWIGLSSISEAAGIVSSGSVDTLIPGSLAKSLEPRDQTNFLPGAPDRDFQYRLLAILMALIAGSLSLEWLTRRLSRLA